MVDHGRAHRGAVAVTAAAGILFAVFNAAALANAAPDPDSASSADGRVSGAHPPRASAHRAPRDSDSRERIGASPGRHSPGGGPTVARTSQRHATPAARGQGRCRGTWAPSAGAVGPGVDDARGGPQRDRAPTRWAACRTGPRRGAPPPALAVQQPTGQAVSPLGTPEQIAAETTAMRTVHTPARARDEGSPRAGVAHHRRYPVLPRSVVRTRRISPHWAMPSTNGPWDRRSRR